MSTHAVAFYPDGSLRVELVGPFRSMERAMASADRLTVALDPPDYEDDELNEYQRETHAYRRPHVLTFITEAEAVEEYGVDWESTDSEHGADWSDWGGDHPEEGPSCKCGFNGSPEECASFRAHNPEPSDSGKES